MANSRQAKKRARQAIKRRALNMSQRSTLRTALKKVRKQLKNNELEGIAASQKTAFTLVDRMINKGILHKNTAARYKSRINAQIKTATKAA